MAEEVNYLKKGSNKRFLLFGGFDDEAPDSIMDRLIVGFKTEKEAKVYVAQNTDKQKGYSGYKGPHLPPGTKPKAKHFQHTIRFLGHWSEEDQETVFLDWYELYDMKEGKLVDFSPKYFDNPLYKEEEKKST